VYLGRFIPSCLSHYAHFTTCACTLTTGENILRGNKAASGSLLFVLALNLASFPRTPYTLGRARKDLTVHQSEKSSSVLQVCIADLARHAGSE
jgi:hypothetical protein